MSFSAEWDERYREGSHMSQWPWSDLVSFYFRYARQKTPGFRVLELGCGAGANIPFFKALGAQYFAIEGSQNIVTKLRERFPEYGENIVVGDFTAGLPFKEPFDIVVDRAALTHNTTDAIRKTLRDVLGALKPGATYLGIDWFSTEHTDYARGAAAEDSYTRTGYDKGGFANLGRVHYADRPHLEDLFKDFELVALEHEVTRSVIPPGGHVIASWNIAARRRG